MQQFTDYVLPAGTMVSRFADLLPDYLPGRDTGAAEATDLRTCWTKTVKRTLEALARSCGAEPVGTVVGALATERQFDMMWRRDNDFVFAAASGWGDRAELDRALERLFVLKCPQKMLFFSCSKWQAEVHEQLDYAVRRYGRHIPGEQYIAVNLLGVERRLIAMLAEAGLDNRMLGFRTLPASPFVWVAAAG